MNIVDTLVVTLGLDTTGLKQGAKDATATAAKLTTDLVSQADRGEKAQTGALANVAKSLTQKPTAARVAGCRTGWQRA